VNKNTIIAPILCLSALSLTGCDDLAALNRRIADFDTAVIKSSDAIQSYYEQLNDLERDFYFDNIRFMPGNQMALTSPSKLYTVVDGKKVFKEYQSGLLVRFNQNDIEVRIAAIKALGKFGEGLALLAGSNAPDRAAKSIGDIGTEIQAIDANIKSLSGAKGEDFTKFAGPISTIGGVVAKHWMKNVQKKAVIDSIVESKEDVLALLQLLEDELTMLDANVLQGQSQKDLNARINYYNLRYKMHKASIAQKSDYIEDSKRKAYLEETKKFAAHVLVLQAMKPQQPVAAMKDSYEKLLTMAADPKSPLQMLLSSSEDKKETQEAFNDLSKSIAAFLADADRVAKAVAKLKQ